LIDLPKSIIKNGIKVAAINPDKLITNAALKYLTEYEKQKYKHIVGK
jgi:hypothetical protein